MKSFDWVTAGQNLFTQGSSYTISSLASDDSAGTALSSYATDQGVYTTGSYTGFGFRFRARASSVGSQTLELYCSAYSAGVTLTAHLSDGSVADVTDVVDTLSGGYNYFVWTVNYQSARDGQELDISATVTTNHGNYPNLKFIAATLY